MAVTITDGWLSGTLPDHTGREIPIVRWSRNAPNDKPSPGVFRLYPPNPCLHTTEGSTVLGDNYKTWDYPPNFACGDWKIVQLYPLRMASQAVDTKDEYLMQVELAFRVGPGGLGSATQVYLPPPSTLNPLVALAAFLHKGHHVSTFLRRPNPDWPVSLDRLPAATDTYYRRNDGTWPKAGVYGHVEIPDDEHYDPASFDYPEFFALVRKVLGEDDDVGLDDYIDGQDLFQKRSAAAGYTDPGPVPDGLTNAHKRAGYSDARWNFLHAKPGPKGDKGDRGDKGDPGDAAKLAPGTTLRVEGT